MMTNKGLNVSTKVQVSTDFLRGVKLLLEELQGHQLDNPTQILCKALQHELDDKFDALERRQAFTQYKSSQAGTEGREEKRQAYLNKAEINESWRSSKEIHS